MKETNAPEIIRKHHWLFAAQMVFVKTDEHGNPTGDGAVLVLNGLTLTPEKRIGVAELGNAQMQAVANLNERFKGERLKVIDCIFLSFTHLGYMSQEEYSVKPEGQALIKTEVDIASTPKVVKGGSHLKAVPTESEPADPATGD